MEHLSLYRGSVRETWKEGSHSGDSERRVIKGSGNSACNLYFSIEPYKIHAQVNLRHLAREGSANKFTGPETVFDIYL